MAHRKKALCACLSYIGLMLFNSYAYAEEVSLAPNDSEVIQDSAVALYEPLESDREESESFEISTPGSAAVLRAAVIPRVVSAEIGERLDGDYAYISDAGLVSDENTASKYAISTGTAPWDDAEEAGKAGNDTSDTDNIVRSFDLVSYTTHFRTSVRDGAPCKAYRTGTLYFRFVLPGDPSQAQYETDSMGWLNAKKDVSYEITSEEINEQTCQVLTGSFLLEPSGDTPSAIGESYQELNIAIRVLAMHEGDTLQPSFTYWLEGNTADGSCPDHNEEEPETITPPPITVTAAPRYNIQLKTCDTRAAYVGSFDFSTGNDFAMNKNAGDVYGRMNVLGITVQIMGKSAELGLRGCEIPSSDTLTFTLTLADEFRGNDGTPNDTTTEYSPLVWSLEGNDKNDHTKHQYDERALTGAYKFAAGGAPFNTNNYDYYTCANGGTWAGTQTGSTVTITVSGYQIDLKQLPYTNSNSNSSNYDYYNPNAIKNYWEVQTACFSAGELWLVQPFYNADGEYVVDRYGTGTFTLTVTDSNLTLDDGTNPDQMKGEDDRCALPMNLEQPGSIDPSVTYQKYDVVEYGTALTDGCYEDGKDWVVAGGQLGIQEMLKHNSAEGLNTGVAYDDLVKFDDAFFVIEGIKEGSKAGMNNMEIQYLYGAKPDKTGWDHHNLQPQDAGYDAEMMSATADDLIFFTSLEYLQEAGYTCVAVLMEVRGLASAQSTNCYFALQGHVADTAQSNAVYMVTHSAMAWNKNNVSSLAAEWCDKDTAALTDDDYITYMQSDAFPSRADGQPHSYADEYATAFWNNNTETTDGLRNYQKSSYDASGYVNGSAGVSYGDSCLVVAYATKLTKTVAQKSSSGQKTAYDMDTNQRIVDYVLNPSIMRTAGESITGDTAFTTNLYIEDTLPAGLHYVPGSAYWGGTYVQSAEGKQGTVQDGTPMEPTITANSNGTTTLYWTLPNVAVGAEEVTSVASIYYSCSIGTPGEEETDVKNNDQLLNAAVIWGSAEQKRGFSAANGNLAEMSILVTKNNAISLVKLADQPMVDAGKDMGSTLHIGNNAANSMELIAVDALPYDGDSHGSEFTGNCFVTEITVTTPGLLSSLTLYATTQESERGKTSANYTADSFTDTGTWQCLTVDSTSGKVTLPQGDFNPVAIAAVGTLPANQILQLHITMRLPDGQPGDHVVNCLTRGDLESDANCYVVSRTLEGIVWLDADKNGQRSDSEAAVNGVKITLMKLKDGGDPTKESDYEPYPHAVISTGKQMNVITGEVSAYETGRYLFTNLPAGTFAVKFSDGTFSLYGYQATSVDVGDDTRDSDAVPTYDGSSARLTQGFIADISMPTAEEMTTLVYSSKYHDMGLYLPEAAPDTGLPANNRAPYALVLFPAGALLLLALCKRKRVAR